MRDLVAEEIKGKNLEITRINAGNTLYTEEARAFVIVNKEEV